ncbi:MAG: anti-sigma factor antagonist [Thermoleophilaceae bacterium]
MTSRPSSGEPAFDLQVGDREIDAETHVVEASGQLDLYTAPDFKERLVYAAERGKKHLVVDLSGLTFMDSTGLGVLVGAWKRVRPFGGSVTVVAVDERIVKLFELSGLAATFPIEPTLDSALAVVAQQKAA